MLDRLKGMDEDVSAEAYESALLNALPKKYELIKQRHYEDTSLGIDPVKRTAINYQTDMKSRERVTVLQFQDAE